MHQTSKIIRIFRWIARIWSLLLIGFGALEVIDSHVSRPVPWHEWLGPLLLFTGVLIGFVLSWRWERAGGIVIIIFHVSAIVSASLSRGEIFPLNALLNLLLFFTTPGVLFLLCSYLDDRTQQRLLPS